MFWFLICSSGRTSPIIENCLINFLFLKNISPEWLVWSASPATQISPSCVSVQGPACPPGARPRGCRPVARGCRDYCPTLASRHHLALFRFSLMNLYGYCYRLVFYVTVVFLKFFCSDLKSELNLICVVLFCVFLEHRDFENNTCVCLTKF